MVGGEHVRWLESPFDVEVGDEITIKILDVEGADEPVRRERAETDAERARKVSDGLTAARALLPSPLEEGEWLASLRGYDELLATDESEMCVKVLARLGDLNACSAQFWRELSSAAGELQMYHQLGIYEKRAKIDE